MSTSLPQRACLLIAGVCAAGIGLASVPAVAQFGQIFGAPPRPPAAVPGRPAAPLGLPEQMPPEEMDQELQPSPPPLRAPPPPGMARPPVGGVPGPGTVRSQPLAPLPGVTVAPPGPVVPQGGSVDPTRQPGDEVITEIPSQKIENPTAVFTGLDKITGRIIEFEVAMNEKVQFGALQVTPRVCYTRPPTETANTDSFVEVDEVTLQGEIKRLFTGWMFAASPGLNAVEHPIYDVWLNNCKGGATVVSDAKTGASGQQRPAAQRTGGGGPTPLPAARPQQTQPGGPRR